MTPDPRRIRPLGRPASNPAARDRNRLLASLPAAAYARLQPLLATVTLASGDVLCEPGARIRDVYFPRSAMFSLVAIMEDGTAAEVGTVGDEGFVGTPVLLGVASTTTRCVVQIAGDAARMSVAAFRKAVADDAALAAMLLRYTQAFVTQVSQTAACNVLHPIHARCARWLLMADDRAPGAGAAGGGASTFLLTQEYLSYMLGVRREAVSRSARHLQTGGMIRYVRGQVTVLDRAALEAACCECYAIVRDEQTRLLDGARHGAR